MRVLLDTHTFVWWVSEPDRLSKRGLDLFEDDASELYWSPVGTWELALKLAKGKLKLPGTLQEYLEPRISRAGIRPLLVRSDHALALLELPRHHADPFDQMLIAQARVEGLAILTSDRLFSKYEVETVW